MAREAGHSLEWRSEIHNIRSDAFTASKIDRNYGRFRDHLSPTSGSDNITDEGKNGCLTGRSEDSFRKDMISKFTPVDGRKGKKGF